MAPREPPHRSVSTVAWEMNLVSTDVLATGGKGSAVLLSARFAMEAQMLIIARCSRTSRADNSEFENACCRILNPQMKHPLLPSRSLYHHASLRSVFCPSSRGPPRHLLPRRQCSCHRSRVPRQSKAPEQCCTGDRYGQVPGPSSVLFHSKNEAYSLPTCSGCSSSLLVSDGSPITCGL